MQLRHFTTRAPAAGEVSFFAPVTVKNAKRAARVSTSAMSKARFILAAVVTICIIGLIQYIMAVSRDISRPPVEMQR